MAYENGNEAVNYIGDCIERYRRDPLIFAKAAQLLPVFMARPDWPHSYEEMDRSMAAILGTSLTSLIFGFTERYLHDENIEWPEDLPEGFKEDLEAFHVAVSPIVDQYWMGRTEPMRIFGLARSTTYGDKQVIRFIRMDGATLDLQVDNSDIDRIIRMLEDFRKREVGPTI